MTRRLMASLCALTAALLLPPHAAVDARSKQARPAPAAADKLSRPTTQGVIRPALKQAARPGFTYRRPAVAGAYRTPLVARPRPTACRPWSPSALRRPASRQRAACTASTAATAKTRPTRDIRGLRIVARVRPMTARVFRTRSARALRGLRGAEQQQAANLLASQRVRTSPAAQHTVLAYLKLRTIKGGRGLPISIGDIKSMVGSSRWTSRRLSNLALVLQQARQIARQQKVSPKEAFNRALKQNGIHGKYHSGVCGA